MVQELLRAPCHTCSVWLSTLGGDTRIRRRSDCRACRTARCGCPALAEIASHPATKPCQGRIAPSIRCMRGQFRVQSDANTSYCNWTQNRCDTGHACVSECVEEMAWQHGHATGGTATRLPGQHDNDKEAHFWLHDACAPGCLRVHRAGEPEASGDPRVDPVIKLVFGAAHAGTASTLRE